MPFTPLRKLDAPVGANLDTPDFGEVVLAYTSAGHQHLVGFAFPLRKGTKTARQHQALDYRHLHSSQQVEVEALQRDLESYMSVNLNAHETVHNRGCSHRFMSALRDELEGENMGRRRSSMPGETSSTLTGKSSSKDSSARHKVELTGDQSTRSTNQSGPSGRDPAQPGHKPSKLIASALSELSYMFSLTAGGSLRSSPGFASKSFELTADIIHSQGLVNVPRIMFLISEKSVFDSLLQTKLQVMSGGSIELPAHVPETSGLSRISSIVNPKRARTWPTTNT